MAAEAVHLSALADGVGLPGLPGQLRALLSPGRGLEAARLGAVLVDLPYFKSFPVAATRYFLGKPQPPSAWGDAFHERRPVAVGRGMLAEVSALRGAGDRERADRLLALALGYFSHLAVDYATHGLINDLAAARASRGGAQSAHHHEIEKYQSVLFHEQRNGFDFMGLRHLSRYIGVDARLLLDDPVLLPAFQRAVAGALGDAPSRLELRAWARGYAQYAWLLGTPVGKTLAPEDKKRKERARVFETPTFHYADVFGAAVARVGRYFETIWAAAGGGPFDDAAVPEGSIDHPPRLFAAQGTT